MSQTVQLDAVFIALAVVLFVFFAIAVLIIIDHKAKIPGPETSDLFSVSGIRGNHPVWAWMVSFFLWFIIGSLLLIITYNMLKPLLVHEEEKDETFLGKVDAEARAERLRHFHNSPKEAPYSRGKQPVCYYCHGEFPHAQKPMVRTLLNMHTQFIGCMTCHTDSKKIPEGQLVLKWLNYSGIKTTGKPFGTDTDPVTGGLIETDDYFSKIVPYQKRADGKETLLEITENSDEAREFIAVRGDLTTQQQGAIKKMFHTLVNPVGRFCTRCHAAEEESYIPFRKLGFSEKRITALTNLNIVGIVQKYKEFYIPTIFRGDMSQQEQEVLLGKDKPAPEVDEEMLDDPRSWWRKTYDQ
ncbi:MAG TPA: hypothetical protein ENJ43_03340 [Gammaproteobacteria bacterium]|nr:hypothetical protein [Gammaproteobacteria bacterium]